MLPDIFPVTSSKQNWEILSSELRNTAISSPEGSPEALVWSLQVAAQEVEIEDRKKAALRAELTDSMVKECIRH